MDKSKLRGIVYSDDFYALPDRAKILYFMILAEDDNSYGRKGMVVPKNISKAENSHFKELEDKNFIEINDHGIKVIGLEEEDQNG